MLCGRMGSRCARARFMFREVRCGVVGGIVEFASNPE